MHLLREGIPGLKNRRQDVNVSRLRTGGRTVASGNDPLG